MEPNTKQSFIPREVPLVTATRQHVHGLAELFVLLSIVLFVASAALGAGVFLYGEYLQSSAASKVDQLERAKAAFEPSLIHELTRLDDRMRSAGELLGRHIAPTTFFRMLEQMTITTVSFTSLSFDGSEAQRMEIGMKGIAASVNSIALQADMFSKGGMVTSPIFSDIDRRTEGVHFSLSALLNPAAINYTQVASGATALPIQQNQGTLPFGVQTPPPPPETPSAPSLPQQPQPQAGPQPEEELLQ